MPGQQCAEKKQRRLSSLSSGTDSPFSIGSELAVGLDYQWHRWHDLVLAQGPSWRVPDGTKDSNAMCHAPRSLPGLVSVRIRHSCRILEVGRMGWVWMIVRVNPRIQGHGGYLL